MNKLARVLEWLDDVAADKSAQTVAVPGGAAYIHPQYPVAHSENFVRLTVDDPGLDADSVDQLVRSVFGGTDVEHRVVEVHHAALAERLDPGLRTLGYTRENDLLMLYAGGAPSSSPRVVELGLDERVAVATHWRRLDNPAWPEDFARQLGDRVRARVPMARCTFLAVKDAEGKVVSRADLYQRNGIAQIEEVVTREEARNQGCATELVWEAVRRAGDDEVFIIADADDWPAHLYRRLGFEDLGTTALFVNAPHG